MRLDHGKSRSRSKSTTSSKKQRDRSESTSKQSHHGESSHHGDTRRVEHGNGNQSTVYNETPERYYTARSRQHSIERRRSGKDYSVGDGNKVQHNCHRDEHQGQDQELHVPDRVSDQMLIQAEKFRARTEAPKGKNFSDVIMPYDYEKLRSKFVRPEGLAPIDSEILFLRNFDQDDEFFHVTSQIEPSLRMKIERGEFVDLERLLPRERSAGKSGTDDLNRQLYQLITQGTNNFMDPPVPKSGKVNSIRKWDQAFRVFAAIYTQANPERASEIWQYVYVIHTAAASNPWENVYYYDINFRELMASKPWRSWGKTYTQGWNMAFNNSNSSFLNSSYQQSFHGSGTSKGQNSKSWKDDCCWRYNKNRCKKSGTECNFDHRCTYCGIWNHGFFNCRKRLGRNKKNGNGAGLSGGNTSTTNQNKSDN